MDRGVTQTDTRTAFSGEPEVAKLVGIAAHRILERWDFSADPQGLLDQVVPVVRSVAATSDGGLSTAVEGALGELLMVFGQSPLYSLLRTATILGREVPCLLPWGDGQVMNGVIDVLFRHEGRLWIGDYKTDAVAADEAPHRAERYRAQAAVYQAAVAQSLGESDVSCMLLFLRAGVSVTV